MRAWRSEPGPLSLVLVTVMEAGASRISNCESRFSIWEDGASRAGRAWLPNMAVQRRASPAVAETATTLNEPRMAKLFLTDGVRSDNRKLLRSAFSV